MNVYFVGIGGTSKLSRACDVRLTFFANAIARQNKVIIVNRYISANRFVGSSSNLEEGIEYLDIIKPRNTNGAVSHILYLLSVLIEPFFLIWLNRRKHIDIFHLYSDRYIDFLFYHILSRLFGAKLVYQYVEYNSCLPSNRFFQRLNYKWTDSKGPKYWDGVIAISSFLETQALSVNPKLTSIRIPPLCDFELFEAIGNGVSPIEGKYLLYCGSIKYVEAIDLIATSYRKSLCSKEFKLVMVLSGDKEIVNAFENKNRDIEVRTNLPYDNLVCYYKNADFLLIPLQDSTRDIARFPNKVCEYLASHGIMISTQVGDINTIFTNGSSAILASSFTVDAFTKVFDDIVNGKYDKEQIKQEAYLVGKEYFDITSYITPLQKFLDNTVSK